MHWSDCCLALSHWLIYRSVVYNSWILTMWRPIGVNSPGGVVVTGRVHMIGVCVHSRVKEHVWCCRWRGTAHVLGSRQHVRSRGDPMTMALAGVGGYSVHHGDACHYCYTHTLGGYAGNKQAWACCPIRLITIPGVAGCAAALRLQMHWDIVYVLQSVTETTDDPNNSAKIEKNIVTEWQHHTKHTHTYLSEYSIKNYFLVL